MENNKCVFLISGSGKMTQIKFPPAAGVKVQKIEMASSEFLRS